MLQFLSDWLAADHGRLAISLRDFIGGQRPPASRSQLAR
jgi:hypothetical protein